nr:integrase arm-type DNA-binding domain-containing protein [Sodalis glossinidius]
MALTDLEIIRLEACGRCYRRSDGGGLLIMVTPSGSKLWRFNFRFMGKEKSLSIGKYPHVSLKQAGEAHNKAKWFLSQGKDPCVLKQQEKKKHSRENVEKIAKEWFDSNKSEWSLSYRKAIVLYIRSDVFSVIGKKNLSEIKPLDILRILQKQEKRGLLSQQKNTSMV